MTMKELNEFCRGILIGLSVSSLMLIAMSAVSIDSNIEKWVKRHERGPVSKKEQPPKLILEGTPEVKASE